MIKITKNENILDYLLKNNHYINSPCSGKKICGKCKIQFINTPPKTTLEEVKLLTKSEIDSNIRLACMHKLDYEALIRIITPSIHSIKIIDDILTNFEVNYSEGYGIAIDIGTTTIAMKLYELKTFTLLDTISFINPQSRYASDVISRIDFSSHNQGLTLMNQILLNKINEEIKNLLSKFKINSNSFHKLAIAGNTVMNHLLLKQNPRSLGTYPFAPLFINQINITYKELFLEDTYKAQITIFPGFSAFVGGDILSGVYSLDMHKKEEYTLLIDLGTNGEIILGNKHQLWTSSAAAGPAFEAINIACGCGAIHGAIHSFKFVNNQAIYSTINQEKPIGICGSAVIDLTAELLKNNFIDENGYMDSPYYLTPEIGFFPQDIREVQLAKSAIRTSIDLLLLEAELSEEDIQEVYIAGGFGRHINIDNLYQIGLLPKSFKNKISIVGNSSLSGLVKYLFQPNSILEEIQAITKSISCNDNPQFQDLFVTYLSFSEPQKYSY